MAQIKAEIVELHDGGHGHTDATRALMDGVITLARVLCNLRAADEALRLRKELDHDMERRSGAGYR